MTDPSVKRKKERLADLERLVGIVGPSVERALERITEINGRLVRLEHEVDKIARGEKTR